MPSEKTSEIIESLSKEILAADPGDISSLAGLITALDNLVADTLSDSKNIIHRASNALALLSKKILMDEVPDGAEALRVIAKSVEIIQSSLEAGTSPAASDFPEVLKLAASSLEDDPNKAGNIAHPAVDTDVLSEFLAAQVTVLDTMETAILTLEKGSDEEAFANLRRALHTLKGETGFLGLRAVERVCHYSESLLEDKSIPFNGEHFLKIKDWLAASFTMLSEEGKLNQDPEQALFTLNLLDMQTSDEGKPAADSSDGNEAKPAPKVEPLEIPEAPAAAAEPEAAAEAISVNIDPRPITGDADLMLDFVSESKEHLEQANAHLLDLESDPSNEEALNAVFRAFHTIKGIAGFLELDNIQHLAHDAENLLDLIRKGTLTLSSGLMDVIFDGLDMMTNMIGMVKSALEGDGTLYSDENLPNMLQTIQQAAKGEFVQTRTAPTAEGPIGDILVESGAISEEDLNDVITKSQTDGNTGKIGELLIQSKKVSPKEVATALRRQQPAAGKAKANIELKETIRVDYDRLENMVDTIGELVIAEAMINQDPNILALSSENLTKKLHNLKMVSRQLQEIGTAVRMVPVAGTFQKMARLVRDLSKKSGKPIKFITFGEETELDRAFVDKIGDPLVHMIRNSVDHGIEPPAVRSEQDKPAEGSVTLRAFHEGGNIHIEIQDDGKGLDPDVLFNKALEKGIVTEEDRDRLSDREIFNFIFAAGFSTAAKVTEVSGRGVGMDVVRRNIESLRGQVHINSELGKGTTFRLTLPLTMALIDGMVVRVGKERFIFPVLSIKESIRPEPSMVHTVLGSGEILTLRNHQLPMYRLDQLFKVDGAVQNPCNGTIVIIENQGQQMGILVDSLDGLQQTVIKNLGAGLGTTEGLSGGAIMADGTVGLIVDVPGLLKIARTDTELGGKFVQHDSPSGESPGPNGETLVAKGDGETTEPAEESSNSEGAAENTGGDAAVAGEETSATGS